MHTNQADQNEKSVGSFNLEQFTYWFSNSGHVVEGRHLSESMHINGLVTECCLTSNSGLCCTSMITPPRPSEISMKNWRAKVKPVLTPHFESMKKIVGPL